MVGLGGTGNSWAVEMFFLIVTCFVLILYDLYAIIGKGRVYVVDKMNVKCWGLFLMLIEI